MVVVYLGMAGLFWTQAPDRVPSHFDAASHVDAWSSRAGLLSILGLFGVALPILLAIPWPWGGKPGLLNVPNKDYWIEEGRVAGLTDRVVTFMRLLGGLVSGLSSALLAISLSTAVADGPTHGPPGWVFLLVIGLFLVGLGLDVVKLFRDLKPPKSRTREIN